MRRMFMVICVLALTLVSHAQEVTYWQQARELIDDHALFQGRYRPESYKIFRLDEDLFGRMLEGRTSLSGQDNSFLLSVPTEDGNTDQYLCYHAPVMEPGLASRYPEIGAFTGVQVTDPAKKIYFDYSIRGFHGMIMSPGVATQYIDPVGMHDNFYVLYSRKDMWGNRSAFRCDTKESKITAASIPYDERGADDGKLRTYRLALACTGEYAQYFLNGSETTDAQRKIKVLAAMNTLMVRTNAVFERDFGIHLNLVANNDAVIYLNASNDPWSAEWNNKTQQTIDAVIGNANYDIGHLVHRESSAVNNNGNAGCIGCVCVTGLKGSAFTSHVSPEGDPFVIDYTTHEMGHQLGANHTFTYRTESGTSSQFEPGSGSTIMGYAGITGATDVQPHSDDYFHTRSIEQVTNYIKGSSGGCAVVTVTGNSIPVVANGGSYSIPHSTPFSLTSTASDANSGDILSYTWEQVNEGTASGTMPSSTASTGPCFRSRNNSRNPTRVFPVLASILDGSNANTWEKLPSVTRTLNFRVTVRDNHTGGGANQTADATVSVTGQAGPFLVTAPNTAVSWPVGSVQTISWSVNNSQAAPVNCSLVRILLSVDGGQSFPVILAASTANDGTELLTIPNNITSKARIKVEAVGNIFFDISNTDFIITAAATCGTPAGLSVTNIIATGATVSWAAVGSAQSYDVMYKPASSGLWLTGATGLNTLAVNLGGLSSATLYDWRVRANCSGGSGAYALSQLTTASNAACITAFEPNESQLTAVSLAVNTNITSAINTSTDVDYYKITTTVTSNLNIVLSNLPADYDMSLYNSAGTLIGTATTGGTFNESITLTSQAAGTYYIRVYGYNGVYSTSLCYSLNAGASAATSCSDVYDLASNGTTTGAPVIPFNTAISGLINPSGDIDLYKFVINRAGTISLALTNLPVDVDLQLLNSAGTQVAISQNGGTANETINYTATAGTYYARVYGFSSAFHASSCYTFKVITGTASREEPVPLFSMNRELFIFPNPVTRHMYIQMKETHFTGEILHVINGNGQLLMKQKLKGGHPLIDLSELPTGIYLARVYHAGSWISSPFIKQ